MGKTNTHEFGHKVLVCSHRALPPCSPVPQIRRILPLGGRVREGAHRQAAPSLGVVEDDAEGVAIAGAQRAHAVADVDPVVAAVALDGAVLVGKD